MNPKIVYSNNNIKDLVIISPTKYTDERGENFEGFNESVYSDLVNRKLVFTVDSYSRSVRNVLRGLHGDTINWKLIDVLYGYVYFVAMDAMVDSPSYGKIDTFFLGHENRYQVLLPPGCVNGHFVFSDECLFHYKLSHGFVTQDKQISFKWDDPQLAIKWPTNTPILSPRDR